MLCSRTEKIFSLTAIALALFWPAATAHADIFDDRDELLLANDPALPQMHTPAFGNPIEDHTAQDNADPPEDEPDTEKPIRPKKSERPRFEFDRSGGEDPFAIITRSSTDWMMPDGQPSSVFDNAAAPVALDDTAEVQPVGSDPGAMLLPQAHYGTDAFIGNAGDATIVPSASSGIPTPGALVLIGVGGLLSRRRRRRQRC